LFHTPIYPSSLFERSKSAKAAFFTVPFSPFSQSQSAKSAIALLPNQLQQLWLNQLKQPLFTVTTVIVIIAFVFTFTFAFKPTVCFIITFRISPPRTGSHSIEMERVYKNEFKV